MSIVAMEVGKFTLDVWAGAARSLACMLLRVWRAPWVACPPPRPALRYCAGVALQGLGRAEMWWGGVALRGLVTGSSAWGTLVGVGQ